MSRTIIRPVELRVKQDDLTSKLTPMRHTQGAAGIDLAVNSDVEVQSNRIGFDPDECITFAHTGLSMEIPNGYVGLIIARSSLCKKGIGLANSVGVIDSDYRGEIMLPLISLDGKVHILDYGTRVAQLLLVHVAVPVVKIVDHLSETGRGTRGFGSTGEK